MNAYELGRVLAKQAEVEQGHNTNSSLSNVLTGGLAGGLAGGMGGGILGGVGGALGGAGYGAIEGALTDPEDPERGRIKHILAQILRRASNGVDIGFDAGALLGAGAGATLGGLRVINAQRDYAPPIDKRSNQYWRRLSNPYRGMRAV